MPRDKNIPRRNTEACSEPGFSFHERAGRGRGQSYSTDEQFLARFMTCRWQTVFRGKGTCGAKFQKDSPLTVPTASVLIHDFMCWCVLCSLHTKSFPLSTWETPTPRPSSPFQTSLLRERFSPLTILSASGNSEHSAPRSCFQVLQLLTVSPAPLWVQLYLEGTFY